MKSPAAHKSTCHHLPGPPLNVCLWLSTSRLLSAHLHFIDNYCAPPVLFLPHPSLFGQCFFFRVALVFFFSAIWDLLAFRWNENSASSKRNGNELVHMLQETLARGLSELSNKCFILREFRSSVRHYSISASPGKGVLIACLSGTLGISFQCIVKFLPQFFTTARVNYIFSK